MQRSPESELAAALEAVRAACRAVAAVGPPEAFGTGAVVDKGAAGPVTVADLASQVAAARALRASQGASVAIVGEESAEEAESLGGHGLLGVVAEVLRRTGMSIDAAGVRDALAAGTHAGGPSGRFWTIDPLDGTKGYLRGGQFAVAIALVEDGKPVVGALGLPRLSAAGTDNGEGVVAWAMRRAGAFQEAIDGGSRRPIRAPGWVPGSVIRLAGSVERGHSASDSLEAAFSALGPVEPVRADSQAKYALVARGDADAYVRRSPTPGYREWIWDHAAGALVAGEAGCTVTDALGQELDFSRGRRLEDRSGILCASPELHARAVGVIASMP
jgi:3'(2'), 5'-bisphosphate nucleotidase